MAPCRPRLDCAPRVRALSSRPAVAAAAESSGPGPSASASTSASASAVGRPEESTPAAASERRLLFNSIAPVYDGLNDLLSAGLHRVWKRLAVDWSGAARGGSALDVCCGSGDLAFLLADRVGPKGRVVAVDFSPGLLQVASAKAEEGAGLAAVASGRRAPIK